MNEPQSIAAELLALSILAGEDTNGMPLVKPRDFTHLSLASATAWPAAPFSSLFGYQIPDGYCLIWTYLSLYTTAFDESQLAVNYGFNYDALTYIQIQTGSQPVFEPRTQAMFTQELFNHPLLLVFEPNTTPRIILTPNSSAQAAGSVRVECYAHGYLLPAGLSSAFKPFQTRFG